MATNTTNYNLKKPAQDDFYNVDDFNNNADIIDTQLKANADKAGAALPASDFTGAQILSKMAAAGSVLPVANGGTGEAVLDAFLKAKGAINTGGDVNVYITPGIYQCLNGVLNLPDNGYGLLIVFKESGYVVQLYQKILNDNRYLWKRINTNSAADWSGWVEMIDSSNLASQVRSLLTGGEISVVRQIIKGTVAMPNSTDSVSVTVSLTDAAKAHVILNGSGNASGELSSEPYLVSLTSTTMTLKNNVSASYTVSYQIVEYN